MNRIRNASFLDGVDSFTAYFGAAAVDDADFGAPGREAFVLTKTGGAGSGAFTTSAPDPELVVAVDDVIEVGFRYGVSRPALAPETFLQILNMAESAVLATITIPKTAPQKTFPPRRGIASTYGRAYARIKATHAGRVRVGLQAAAMSNGDRLAMMRPFLDLNPSSERRSVWQPGSHTNPDLDLVAFPTDLPPPLAEGFAIEPVPLRKGFSSDDGSKITVRVAGVSRWTASVSWLLNALDRDRLETFWRANHEEFWYVRPDTGDLCVASWAEDGDPTDSGGKVGSRETTVRLDLRQV